ncbi:MAG: hypothetical protein BWY75_00303 [bacterium ADurb.Bin425]|nr:MAG: hypothetical protein BWY75_00303 [bacterium ADurb.Bin425]
MGGLYIENYDMPMSKFVPGIYKKYLSGTGGVILKMVPAKTLVFAHFCQCLGGRGYRDDRRGFSSQDILSQTHRRETAHF